MDLSTSVLCNKCKYHKLNIFTVFSNHRSTGKLTHSEKHFYIIKAQRNYLQIIIVKKILIQILSLHGFPKIVIWIFHTE